MYQEICRRQDFTRRRYVNSPRHAIQVDWISYMDELASMIGARPQMLKYFFTDNRLFRALLGPAVPYQYRLEGPHRWPGARQAILDSRARMLYPLNDRCSSFETKKLRQSTLFYSYAFLFALVAGYLFLRLGHWF
ncbi:hypothetical protein HPB48_018675 [Haemaphysalis longicornis]|uniref:Flavin-containing monooxygenase n=1 Tax=Haemaphysalis longicornis TaxID=44386 RepID=A0A9J6GGN3_HAELO|nr:hypothetical protein HPB48_018675 [Haemaphysalis longicornis]